MDKFTKALSNMTDRSDWVEENWSAIEFALKLCAKLEQKPSTEMYSAGSRWYLNHGAISGHIPTGCFEAMLAQAKKETENG